VKLASIVYNPAARNAPSHERLRRAGLALKPDGWEVELRATEAAGHARTLASEAVQEGANVVFACGGDGTLNEVINGIAGSSARLGVIRGGTGNVFAKEIGVPRAPERALALLNEGEERRFDLGKAGERYFIAMCGVGFDAAVVRRVSGSLKRRVGTAAYIVEALLRLPGYQGHRTVLRGESGTREVDLFWLLLGNTRSYGGVFDIARTALADDGLLDAHTYAGRGVPWILMTGLRVLARRTSGAPGISFERLSWLAVETPGLPVQADGEYFGETPMRFSVERQALPVLLPRGGGRQLLGGG
jgi:YegS/Rv2252/BmrU family lipid kinase